MKELLNFQVTFYKKILAALTIVFLVFILTSCSNNIENTDEIELTPNEVAAIALAKETQLKVGIENGDLISSYVFNQIELFYEIEFEYIYYDSFSLLLNDVMQGNIDFVSNITYTLTRAESLDYSVPLSYEEIYLYSRELFTSIDMKDKVIGVQESSVYVSLIEEYLPEVTVVLFDDTKGILDMLENGTIDGIISNDIFLEEALISQYNIRIINDLIPADTVAIVSQLNKNTMLLSAISKYIESQDFRLAYQDYLSSKNNAIIQNYVKVLVNDLFLPTERSLDIKLENISPYTYYSKNGSVTGIMPDLLKQICEITEFDCQIVSQENETWDSMFTDLKEDRIDVLGPVAKSAEREEYLYFSDPIILSEYHIVKRSDYSTNYSALHQLAFEKIGLIENDFTSEIIENQFPNKSFTYYQSNSDLIAGLVQGEVDYIMLNDNVYYNYVIENNEFSIIIDSSIDAFSAEIAFAFPKTEEGSQLAYIFSLTLFTMDTSKIVNDNLVRLNLIEFYQDYRTSWTVAMIASTAVIIVLIGIQVIFIRYQRKIKFNANHDFLTGILNKRGFVDKLTRNSDKKPYAILYIDLDNFKHYNDLDGHKTGDLILVELANRFKKLENNQMIVSRFGGDEFVIWYQYKNIEDVEDISKRIFECISRDIEINFFKCYLSASIGISVFPKDGNDVKQIIENAELAMRVSKESKSEHIVKFDLALLEKSIFEFQIVDLLQTSILNKSFEMVYQPQISIVSNQFTGIEALLRIKNNGTSPEIFVPIAEKSGLMNKIGRIVIELTVEQVSLWKQKGLLSFPVYINFSSTQLHDKSIIEYLLNILKKYDVNPNDMGIELTEDIFLGKKDMVVTILKELKSHGFKTAIDDFGSGLAGINYLTNFEVDLVKIGKEVADKFLTKDNINVYATIVNLCQTMGFKVLAEGIETDSQISLLKNIKVDNVQGYFYYKPLKPYDIELLLDKANQNK